MSTRLHHDRQLTRDHVREIAAHGFERIEVFAIRTHFDYHSSAAIADLQQWLAEAGLELDGVHAPVAERSTRGRWDGPLTLASADRTLRERALEETERALQMARRIPFGAFIVHLGLPRPAENSRDAARRSIDSLRQTADPLGVRLALEVIPNELSRAASLVYFVEEVVKPSGVGICLDFGHAHMDGDLIEAIETVSEHLMAAHVHDNHGRTDEHLMPFEGSIDWPAALTAVQKVGYEGTLIFEIASNAPLKETLRKARSARGRMERMLTS